MAADQKTIALLQTLGLTVYEAKAYAALTRTGSTTPFLLAEEAGIPRTRIYETIKRLEQQHWVTVEKGRPGKVTPLCPHEVIGSRRSELDADIDRMEKEFTMNVESRTEQESPKATIIHGLDMITGRTIEMMKGARTSLYLFGTLYYPEELEPIKRQIAAAKRRGVTIKISSNNPVRMKGEVVDLYDSFSEVTRDMQVAPEPLIRTLTIDGREMLMMFPLPDSDLSYRENLIALWVENASVTKAINTAFNLTWGDRKWTEGK